MKPIEPGCACIIVGSIAGNNGKSVTAIEYAGENIVNGAGGIRFGRVWRIDRLIPSVSIDGIKFKGDYLCKEKNLLRIDGYDFSHEKETEQELVK